jgi:uncharacterized membrane protein YhhN
LTLPRLVLLAAIAAGVSYMMGWGMHPAPAVSTVWKGAGVGLLALYATSQAKSLDGWLLAAVMALGCAGDVLLETSGLKVGALAFLGGHLVAIALYLRNRSPALTVRHWILAALLVPSTVATAWSLPFDRSSAPGIALYAAGLGAMAACAYLSRFRRDRVALGALMFLVSDQLIFARAGPLHGVAWVSDAVWILYFSGQTLIAMGVREGLEEAPPVTS